MNVATSIIRSPLATPALAAQAVQLAMEKAGISRANGVLLLATAEFSQHLKAAIQAAANTAHCTQVMGCSASGIFTEEDWVLDCAAIAVMVFGGDVHINLANDNPNHTPLLTLSAPNAINAAWLNDGNIRYGGVAGDANGQGAFSVWQNAKGVMTGYVEAYFSGVNMVSATSHGFKILSTPVNINDVAGFDLYTIEETNTTTKTTAYAHLKNALHHHQIMSTTIPQHLIMAIYAEDEAAILRGEYTQTPIISLDERTGHVTLANALNVGQTLCWALRDEASAQHDLALSSQSLQNALAANPAFGLMFSCIGRGPFYDGIDHDLNTITKLHPNMPLLGFYGNGTIANIAHHNHLLPHSVVLNFFG
jgi:small ligand-binding sensory domain FIST